MARKKTNISQVCKEETPGVRSTGSPGRVAKHSPGTGQELSRAPAEA